MTPINTIVFDLDGTLIDSSDGVVAAVNYALAQVGLEPQSEQVIRAYIGDPLEKMFADFTTHPSHELYRHFQTKAAHTVVASASPLEGVTETLAALHSRGIRMAIATTKIKVHVDGILDRFQWHDYFQATVGGNEVDRVKPDPAPFLLALNRLGVTPQHALAVGDTVNDIRAARGVPMRVAAVPSPYGGNDKVLSLRPDFLLSSLSELLDLLDNAGKRTEVRI